MGGDELACCALSLSRERGTLLLWAFVSYGANSSTGSYDEDASTNNFIIFFVPPASGKRSITHFSQPDRPAPGSEHSRGAAQCVVLRFHAIILLDWRALFYVNSDSDMGKAKARGQQYLIGARFFI